MRCGASSVSDKSSLVTYRQSDSSFDLRGVAEDHWRQSCVHAPSLWQLQWYGTLPCQQRPHPHIHRVDNVREAAGVRGQKLWVLWYGLPFSFTENTPFSVPSGTLIAKIPSVRSISYTQTIVCSLAAIGATPAQSKQLYDQIISQRPSTILALNHETYGESFFHELSKFINSTHSQSELRASNLQTQIRLHCWRETLL
jgi:hypothetical protein